MVGRSTPAAARTASAARTAVAAAQAEQIEAESVESVELAESAAVVIEVEVVHQTVPEVVRTAFAEHHRPLAPG